MRDLEQIRAERIKLQKENDDLIKQIHQQLKDIKKREDEINTFRKSNYPNIMDDLTKGTKLNNFYKK